MSSCIFITDERAPREGIRVPGGIGQKGTAKRTRWQSLQMRLMWVNLCITQP